MPQILIPTSPVPLDMEPGDRYRVVVPLGGGGLIVRYVDKLDGGFLEAPNSPIPAGTEATMINPTSEPLQVQGDGGPVKLTYRKIRE